MRPKLTRADLHAIGQSNKSPEVVALLFEIRRMRALVLRADQLQKMLGPMGGAQGLVLDSLRAELEGEPCVEEFPKLEADSASICHSAKRPHYENLVPPTRIELVSHA